MKLQKSELKWLLIMLLPIALIPASVIWQWSRTASYATDNTAATDAEGESDALATLSMCLESDPTNTITVQYSTTQHKKLYRKIPPTKAQSESALIPEALVGVDIQVRQKYDISYNRRRRTLTKSVYDSNEPNDPNPTRISCWQNVDETAIHQIASPMRKLYGPDGSLAVAKAGVIHKVNGGKLEELEIYGATLAPETNQ